MVNPGLLISGIGMVAVAVVLPLYWKLKTGARMNCFFWGAGVWVVAIAVKIFMDYTVTSPINAALGPLGIVPFIVLMGLYLGLRTGLLESGLSYFAILKTRLRDMDYREGVAFGIGFGSIEALFLGITSLMNVLMFMMMPDLIMLIPEAQQATILAQLNASTWIALGPVIERVSIMFIHVFSTLLVLYAVKERRIGYLGLSILFKTVVDGIIPWVVLSAQPIYEVFNAYLIEVPFIILAVIAFFGIRWIRPRFR